VKIVYRLFLIATLLSLPIYVRPQDGEQRGPDGHYHDHQGNVQPDICNNYHENIHPCDCNRSSTDCDVHDHTVSPGSKCQTYCRDKACKCVSPCDS
jgi:hypothetical protein